MTPWWSGPDATFYVGDVLTVLAELPAESVHAVCTSPPYFGLRSYGLEPSVWGGDASCGHSWIGEIVPAQNGIINGGMRGNTISPKATIHGRAVGELGVNRAPGVIGDHGC